METIIYLSQAEITSFEFLMQFICTLIIFQKDLVVLIMSLELIFLTISLEILDVTEKLDDVTGQILVLFILSVAACESALALAFFLTQYQEKGLSKAVDLKYLKG